MPLRERTLHGGTDAGRRRTHTTEETGTGIAAEEGEKMAVYAVNSQMNEWSPDRKTVAICEQAYDSSDGGTRKCDGKKGYKC